MIKSCLRREWIKSLSVNNANFSPADNGEGRPIIGAGDRLRILAALAAVDYVTVFTSHQLPELLASLQPDILTKGSNYPAEQVAGAEIVASYGGQVVLTVTGPSASDLIPVTEPVSASDLIQRIKNGGGG